MSRKSIVLLIVFVLLGSWLCVVAYLLRSEHNRELLPEKEVTFCAHTSAPVTPSSTPSHSIAQFKPVASGRLTHVTTTPTIGISRPSHRSNPSSGGWTLHQTSSATVHSIGGGGNGGAGIGTATNSGSNRSGVTQSYNFSVNTNGGLALATSSMPLLARNVEGGMTADQTLQKIAPRRVIINDDDDDSGYGNDDLRPTDPSDPYFTPVGDIPWLIIGLLCLLFGAIRETLRHRRKVCS